MTRRWRTIFALLAGSAVACAPILGLDDLRERDKVAQVDSGSDVDSGPVVEGPKCTANAECIKDAQGNPSLCVAGKCVDVNPLLCRQDVLPNKALLEREDTIVVAAFLRGTNPRLSGPGLAYELALNELEDAKGILGRTPHHLAMLLCDADPAKVDDAIKHVVHDLRLPVILASFGSGTLAQTVVNDVVDAGTFTLNPSYTTDYLKFAGTKRLVLSLLGTGEDVALAYRPVLEELKKAKGLPSDIKVALVATNGSLDQPMANLLERGQIVRTGDGGFDTSKALLIDGTNPEADSVHFKRFEIGSREFAEVPDPQKLSDAKAGLIAFDPDVIIALTDDELDSFVREVDETLIANRNAVAGDAGDGGDAGSGANRKTYWILGPSNGGVTLPNGQPNALGKYLAFNEPNVDTRRERFIGIQFAGAVDRTEGDKFRKRMFDKNKDAGVPGFDAENFYDAIYWIAYGIASAGPDAPVQGRSFSDGVAAMLEGPQVYAGDRPTIEAAFSEINQLKGTTFVGALGPPDINKASGTWNSVGSTYCYPPRLEFGPMPTYDNYRYLPDGGLAVGDKPLTCAN